VAAAVWLGMGLSLAAQNCNSLNMSSSINQDKKVSTILSYNADVVLLSDVRLNGKDRIFSDKLKLWYKVYFNSTKNSRGVAVLIRNQVEHELLESAVDPQENVILLRIVLGGVEAVIGAVYGPNDNNCAPFFDFIGATLNRWNNLPCILGGDWNATPSSLPAAENPDIFSMNNIPSKVRSEGVEALCNDFDLSDPYRVLDPETRDFTYVPSGVVRKNRSRIDFFLCSSDLYDGINSCTIAQGFSRKSFDHKPIFLNFQKKKGKGRACVYNSTVNHKLAEDIVRLAVHNNTIRSALVAAGPAVTELLNIEMDRMNNIVNLINRYVDLQGSAGTREQTEAEQEELMVLEADLATEWAAASSIEYLQSFERQVTADVFFENLVEDCKTSLITLQNRVKSAANRERKAWTSELAVLKKSGAYGANVDRINYLETKLNEASDRYVSERLGNYIKTEVLNSEKMTPKFLKIAESSQKTDLSVIKRPDGTLFTRDCDRNRYIVEFYEELYKKPAAAPVDFRNCVTDFLGNLCDHPAIKSCCISEAEKADLELDITIEELDEAVKSCNLKSAPGIDGFNNRFILKFWRHFRKPLHDYFTYCYRTGSLTPTFRTALIKLIPKKGDLGQLKNWRPISLLSCFYKIISKAVNARLDKIIDKVTSLDQKAYNKNRYIQEALINTIDAIRHCEKNNISGVVLSIDQKKAFDSVYHGYMREVYKFFGFGEKFIYLLELIGTGRTARIILEGSISREFGLERGFAQGNGPSPKKYNIGEQILLFRLEYDPMLAGVYTSFIIPRNIVNGVEYLPAVDQAREKGLQVDSELCQNKRRATAFADDTSGFFARQAQNLLMVKNILIEFGRISGLETNIEKTTIMPIGNLHEPVPQEIIELGFAVVTEQKTLGLTINNTASNLNRYFDTKIGKVRSLIGKWGSYNLSFTGRIAISKTMLVSQIGYIGCIITPSCQQLKILQDMIDSFVTQGTVVARDRLYIKPKEGGLGLINLSDYVTALQCSWVKRCTVKINDSWRWRLASACNFNLEMLRKRFFDAELEPVLYNIAESFEKIQWKFWALNENYLMAPLVDNKFFLRAAPERRAPVLGCVDRNLVGPEFYAANKEALQSLRMNCLIRGNHIVTIDALRRQTGLNFSNNAYLNLVTAANYAKTKYGNKEGSNGTCIPLTLYLQRIKKGSRKFRLLLSDGKNETGIEKMRVVETFFRLIDSPVPSGSELGVMYGSWNFNFFENRLRTFCFRFFNNSIGVGARIAARYRGAGQMVNDRCTFCLKAGAAVPAREDFIHIFYDCPYIRNTVNTITDEFFPAENDANVRRKMYMSGSVTRVSSADSFFLQIDEYHIELQYVGV